MRDAKSVFHLAIPVRDLAETQEFYVEKLGCKLARHYADRITLDFFGGQVVCHLAPEHIDREVSEYPRHFGITFQKKDDFDRLVALARARQIPFFKEPVRRFQGKVEEHWTTMLLDPSNNVIEFKCYNDPLMMY